MKIFGFPLSPYVRKVAVAATMKGIEFEWEPSNPNQPTDEFLKASPFSKIPAIADGDFTLADSTAIVAYLEAKYPEPALLPKDAEGRGRAVWFDEVADTLLIPSAAPIVLNRFLYPKIFGKDGDEAAALAAEDAAMRSLDYLEGQLGEDGWFDGPFTLGDLSVACAFKTLSYAGWSVNSDRHPKLAAWYERIASLPAWQEVAAREAGVFASLGS